MLPVNISFLYKFIKHCLALERQVIACNICLHEIQSTAVCTANNTLIRKGAGQSSTEKSHRKSLPLSPPLVHTTHLC